VNPESSPIYKVPPERLEELDSSIRDCFSNDVSSVARALAPESSENKGPRFETIGKFLELGEKVRSLGREDQWWTKIPDLFDAMRNALLLNEEGVFRRVVTLALAVFNPSTLAVSAACAALLACLKDSYEFGFIRKRLDQVVVIFKQGNYVQFTYSLAHVAIRSGRIERDQFNQCRQGFLRSKSMWFRHFETDIQAARKEGEFISACSNLYYASLAMSTDFCLCDVVGEAYRFLLLIPSDLNEWERACQVLLRSKIAREKPVLAQKTALWIDRLTAHLRTISETTRTTSRKSSWSSSVRMRAVFRQWAAKTA
jgi:hypothetical protein